MPQVALVSCESYNEDAVRAAVERGLSLLGGAQAFVRSGEKILLKPNWLSSDPPEKCVTTHSAVFRAVAEALLQAGAVLSYGDSPGFQPPETAAKKTGCAEVAQSLGIPLADMRTGKEVHFPQGRQNKKFILANAVLDSDGVVSLPKMKTHAFQRVTGAVKNQFGCIPGTLKSEFHVKIPDAYEFAKMLIDLNACIRPRLYVMDAVVAMEGNGPRGGTPKPINALLLSADPVALDATMCRMMNLDPALVLTNRAGMESGFGTYLSEEITLLGDPIESFVAGDFNVNRAPNEPATQKTGSSAFKNAITPRPYIDGARCVKCGVCVNACPVNPKAVNWHDGDKSKPPSYQYDRCIRCYCCQEMCPESAILVKVPLLRRIIGG